MDVILSAIMLFGLKLKNVLGLWWEIWDGGKYWVNRWLDGTLLLGGILKLPSLLGLPIVSWYTCSMKAMRTFA